MIHDFIDPISVPIDDTDGTAMTHRTAAQSFEQRRHIEKNRSTIGSYQAAAKKAQIEAHQTVLGAAESTLPKADYYRDVRESMGIKSDTTKRNPYSADRQSNGTVPGREKLQLGGAKSGGLEVPKRGVEPKFREPPTRSFNPYG